MKILVVDDSKAMRMIVIRTLRQAGYGSHTIMEAKDGKDGYDVVQEHNPHLILCDWNMPEMNGLDLLVKIRADGNSCIFGFVTSEANPEMKATAMEAGASFFITKPFTVEAFQASLQPVCGK